MGQLYVKVAFPPEPKAKMEKLIGNLSDALKLRIENLAWMSPETKEKALEKWKTFDPRVGYPDKWRDWTGLETGRESYLDNVLAAREFNYQRSDEHTSELQSLMRISYAVFCLKKKT